MCYELFKDGVLVYTDCLQSPLSSTNATSNATLNATLNARTNATSNATSNASSSLLSESNVFNSTIVYNTSNTTLSISENTTSDNHTCCACSNIISNITTVVHHNVSTTRVVSNFSSSVSAKVDEGTWIAVLLCISLFCLCIVRNYARLLRSKNAKILSLYLNKGKTLKDVVPKAQPVPPTQHFENPLQQSQKKPYVKLVRKKKNPTGSKKKKYLVASEKTLQDNLETKS